MLMCCLVHPVGANRWNEQNGATYFLKKEVSAGGVKLLIYTIEERGYAVTAAAV